MIYETKGLTLEEVDDLYSEVSSARASVGWSPSITFVEMREKAEAQGAIGEHHEIELRVDSST